MLAGHDNYDFDPGAGTNNLIPTVQWNDFVLKLDTAGNFIWVKQISGNGSVAMGTGLALDAQEHVYTTGIFFSGTVDFDPGPANHPRTAYGGEDMFLSQLDSAGNFVYVNSSSGTSDTSIAESYAIALDDAGNACTIGRFSYTVNFLSGDSKGDLISKGEFDVFVAKADPSGNLNWIRQFGDLSSNNNGEDIAVDPSGSLLYITGRFIDTVDFDPGPGFYNLISSGPEGDTFIAKYCIAGLDVRINVNGFELGTVGHYDYYQWLLNGKVIPGTTDSTYDVKENGDYSVVVANKEGCSDTSDVYPVNNYTGIEGISPLARQIQVYPNPSKDWIYIKAPEAVDATLTDVSRRFIFQVKDAHAITKRCCSGFNTCYA